MSRWTYLGLAGCLGCLAVMLLVDSTHLVLIIKEDVMLRSLRSLIVFVMLLLSGLFGLALPVLAAGPQQATPPLDITTLLGQFLALAGVGALIALLINIGKQVGIVKDGDTPTWVTGLNLLGLVGLFVLRVVRPDADIGQLDGIASTIAQIGVLVLALITQIGSAKVAHAAVRGAAVIGYSFSVKRAQAYTRPRAGHFVDEPLTRS